MKKVEFHKEAPREMVHLEREEGKMEGRAETRTHKAEVGIDRFHMEG